MHTAATDHLVREHDLIRRHMAAVEAFAREPSVGEVLAREDWWGRDLRQLKGFAEAVSRLLPQ